MNKKIIAVTALTISLFAGVSAFAQDPFNAPVGNTDTPPAAYQPQADPTPAPAAAPAAEADSGWETKTIRGFIGPRLGLHYTIFGDVFGDDTGAFAVLNFSPQLEGGIWILDRFEVYAAVGAIIYGGTLEDGDNLDAMREGNLLLQLGVRFHITEARPKHAFLYTGLDFTGIVGVSKLEQKVEGESTDGLEDQEKLNKEAIDQWMLGIQLGVEYLVSNDFGIGAESGIKFGGNGLKDGFDPEPDKARVASFQIPFMLRFMYHF